MTTQELAEQAATYALAIMERDKRIERLESGLISVKAWCFPAPSEMPDDSDARCEWYARRLLGIANAATAALNGVKVK